MANFKVFVDLAHPVYGRGYRLWELHRFFEDHFDVSGVSVVDYVCKVDKVSVLTLFIPHGRNPATGRTWWEEVRQVDWLKKAAAAKAATGPKETEVTADGFAEKFPATFAFLAASTADGKPRELCKLQVFADSGVWKAALHDPNTEHSIFCTLGSPQDVFKAVEKALTAESPDWRSWGRGKAKKR